MASNANELKLVLPPDRATTNALFDNRKTQAVEALQDTGRWLFGHSKFLDIDTTLGYPSRFLSGVYSVRKCRGCSSVGRALEWHSRGQGFDSPHLHGFAVRRERLFVFAGIAQLVEHNLAKVGVAGSSPVSRSPCDEKRAVSSVG